MRTQKLMSWKMTKNDAADVAIAERLAKAGELAQSKAGQTALAEAHADAMVAAEKAIADAARTEAAR